MGPLWRAGALLALLCRPALAGNPLVPHVGCAAARAAAQLAVPARQLTEQGVTN